MATRKQLVEQVAGNISDQIFGAIQYDATLDPAAEAARINDGEGWTVELSAPLGHTLRCEGVHLSQHELAYAVDLAERMLLDPESCI